jgi:hypothetical protein
MAPLGREEGAGHRRRSSHEYSGRRRAHDNTGCEHDFDQHAAGAAREYSGHARR